MRGTRARIAARSITEADMMVVERLLDKMTKRLRGKGRQARVHTWPACRGTGTSSTQARRHTWSTRANLRRQ